MISRRLVAIVSSQKAVVPILGTLAILFGAPLTAAVENDDIQTPAAVTLAAAPAAISQNSRGTVRARVLFLGAVVALCPVSLRRSVEHVANVVFRDCRSNLRSLCLLRC